MARHQVSQPEIGINLMASSFQQLSSCRIADESSHFLKPKFDVMARKENFYSMEVRHECCGVFFPFSCESYEIKKGEMTGKVGKKQKKPENNEKPHVFPSCVGPVSRSKPVKSKEIPKHGPG